MTTNFKTQGAIRLIAVAMSMVLVSSSALIADAATLAEQLKPDAEYGVSFDYQVNDNYQAVLNHYSEEGFVSAAVSQPIHILASEFTNAQKAPDIIEQDGQTGVVRWAEDNDYLEWTVNIPSSGLYSIQVTYEAANDNGAEIVRALTIDGNVPFQECSSIALYRKWIDDGKPIVNSIGDEVRPGVDQMIEWQTSPLFDPLGMYDEALKFYIEQGSHTLRLSVVDEPLLLKSIEIYASEVLPSYKEVEASYEAKGYRTASKEIRFEAEGEQIAYKSSSTLRMSNDGDPLASPQAIGSIVMNVLGGSAWQNGNSSVTWTFDVEEAGLYKLALRVRQNYREGLPSYRRIEIDGETPFKEWQAYKFSYNKNWRNEVLSNESGNPYYIYLEAGKNHTLTMSAKQGDLNSITQIITADSLRLSEMLLKITMITGRNPDINYDYELDIKIPTLLDTMSSIAENMHNCMDVMEKVSNNRPSKYYQMESMIVQINALIEDPFYIPRQLDVFNTILTTYGEWATQFQQQPLMLDYIELVPINKVIENLHSNFFQNFAVSTVNFLKSFIKDYDSILGVGSADYEITTTLDVWIGRGKDWGMLLKQMADEEFTPKTGIGVRMNILPAGQLNAGNVNAMLLAISSGRAPDVGLATPTASIGEFALRNAVCDLSQFSDFEDIRKQFMEELFIPMTYNNGIYGLPETMKFTAMIYRKDILSQLGLSLPNTWEELYDKVIPVLYQNNMQFYMPGGTNGNVDTGFSMFLYQLGGQFYSDDLLYSAYDSPEAYQAFREYTEIFTLYGVPLVANFFNRFRSGETPIGISDYGEYMQLLAAAPELNGKWGIAPIPGHEMEDGTINRTHTGILAESSMIMSQSDNQEEAWEFLKWWMSTEVQQQYGNEIESLIGKAARWNTANTTAFESLAWPRDDLVQIRKSFENITQIPVVLGGYFCSRHIGNAFNRVVVSGANPRDSLEEAVEDINHELKRRRESTAAGEDG